MDMSSLTTDERSVVEVLFEDWKDLLLCTSIDQGMARLSIPFSHASRLRIAEFLIGDQVASGLMRWAPSIYVLTNQERLVARCALQMWRQGRRNPQPDEDQWAKSGWTTDQMEVAFDAIGWLGFMRKEAERYELVDDPPSFLKGIGFYFHEVVLTGRDERFNTNCAPDFFIMTNPAVRERFYRPSQLAIANAGEGMSDKMVDAARGVKVAGARPLRDTGFYGNERAILNDACAWSDELIQVVMDQEKLVVVKPETTWYLLAGG
jgi:hypothetical protein